MGKRFLTPIAFLVSWLLDRLLDSHSMHVFNQALTGCWTPAGFQHSWLPQVPETQVPESNLHRMQ